jgi:UDP-glucose 4-epimerase
VNEMARDLSILVTGGAGYIGAHCCKALSEAGYVPVCIDDLSTGSRDFVKWGPLVVGNVRDTALVAETIRSHRIAAVMHFAAFSQVGESESIPRNTIRTM